MVNQADCTTTPTLPERMILEALGEVWNMYRQLRLSDTSDVVHSDVLARELNEFLSGIHRLQDMIAARASYRFLRSERTAESDG